jgi:hypothetical protein
MAQPSAYPVPRERLRDYLTDADRRRIRRGALLPFTPKELAAIQLVVNGTEMKASYPKSSRGVPKKPFSCGVKKPRRDSTNTKRAAIIAVAPKRIADAQPVRWFKSQLNPPISGLHAMLSDMYKKGVLCRRPMKRTGIERHCPSMWAYWKP